MGLRSLSLLVAAALTTPAAPPTKSYLVREGAVHVDGVPDDLAWERAEVETGFVFPWQSRQAPPTELRALADEARLYFVFNVVDDDIVIDPAEDEAAVARGDRVELFFATDVSLDEYFCFEIDPSGRVLDYRASHYREFDREWDFPGLDVAAALTESGYVVEGSLPLSGLPVSPSGKILTGVFRAEYGHGSGDEPVAEWISWVRPDADEPDFHIPSAFGVFEIVL